MHVRSAAARSSHAYASSRCSRPETDPSLRIGWGVALPGAAFQRGEHRARRVANRARPPGGGRSGPLMLPRPGQQLTTPLGHAVHANPSGLRDSKARPDVAASGCSHSTTGQRLRRPPDLPACSESPTRVFLSVGRPSGVEVCNLTQVRIASSPGPLHGSVAGPRRSVLGSTSGAART